MQRRHDVLHSLLSVAAAGAFLFICAAPAGAENAEGGSDSKAAAAGEPASGVTTGALSESKSDSKSGPTAESKADTDAATKTGAVNATPDQSAPEAAGTTTEAPAPPADPIIEAVRAKIADPAVSGKSDKADMEAMTAFYAERSGPALWVEKDGFTAKAKKALEEFRKAEDWGLDSESFDLPASPPQQADASVLGEAEARLGLALLKYARYAKGGRFNPSSLSRILDVTPPVKDPKAVLAELAATDAPDAYMRNLHPKHEQFERLRQALIKTRGPAEPEAPADEALKIKLPPGKLVKKGAEHADVALLRKRLKVPTADDGRETLLDDELADALKAFQREKGLASTGNLNGATRSALNGEGEPKRADGGSRTQRLLINMERWRWMPEDLGPLYVWNNIPEFMARVIKGDEEIFKEKIIVGLPEWATPVFSAEMKYVIFNPSWGVPDGIKMRELLPRLKSASGGFFFFGGGGGDVLRAYGLTAYRGGRQIDPDSVDWGSVDIRNYSFIQPPGGKNPLGIVKFRFPNKWDVYMHDTVQRELFAQSNRALSHGCIRVENPRQLAALLLAEDKGWSADQLAQALRSGSEITLDKHIPVHNTYFTAMVDEDGKVSTYGDLYGHDSRLAAALSGKSIRFEEPVAMGTPDNFAAAPVTKERKSKKKSTYKAPSSLAEAISGLLAN